MKALFGLWSSFKVSQINRLLRPFNVRLVLKKSKDWGAQVSLTAHAIQQGPTGCSPCLEPAPGVFSDPPSRGEIIAVGDLGVQRVP